MSALTPEDFPAFFEAVHGYPPFLWQHRLLSEVAEKQQWPRVIAAPTGAGKTAVLDIALFHLAIEAHKGASRAAPVRICFAVDRRIIVDQAFDRAKAIQKVLLTSSDPIVARVAEALKAFSGQRQDGAPDRRSPLHVEQLRGGMPREDDWARTPAQPTILCTTIDQLGSRLLFRGYGVSERMAPVHAGLLGEDCLIILDEAHLSAAFVDTLEGVSRRRAERAWTGAAQRWGFCELTATPRAAAAHRFELITAEREEPAIQNRLKAEKICALVDTDDTAGSGEHLKAFVTHAGQLAGSLDRPDPMVAIIVNRVPFARTIFEALKGKHGEDAAILLTGRVRPVERDNLIEQYRHRLFAGERADARKPLFVVATQCVEAGADFDFDALVTQIAPLDALRQRFGRLDRLGGKSPTHGVLIAAKDEIAKSAKPDPIYGDRAKATWEWLRACAAPGTPKNDNPWIDFGPNAMQALIGAHADQASKCVAEPKQAPVLRAADVTFLSMTHPRPHPDPEISLFLHGELGRDTDVSIVWRADIEDCFNEKDAERLGTILDLARPRPGEALRIPLWAAQRWMRAQHDAKAPLADVDAGAPQNDLTPSAPKFVGRRKRGDKAAWEFVDASKIRPGDTLIAPSSHGGCDGFGWAPESDAPVDDIAEAAAKPYEKRRAFLRLHPRLWRQHGGGENGVSWEHVAALIAHEGRGAKGRIDVLLEALPNSPEGAARFVELRTRLERMKEAPGVMIERPYDDEENEEAPPAGAMLWARRGLPSAAGDDIGEAVTDEGDAGSFMASALKLSVHRSDVEEKARAFASGAGLPRRLIDSVALAALLHDDGKGDPRFQTYLTGGAIPAEPLAKADRRPRGEDRAARRASKLPEHWRHEALSVRLAIAALQGGSFGDIDQELVVWLVGTHHGYGRPFFPHDDSWDDHVHSVGDVDLQPAPGPQRLDFEWRGMDWAQLFEKLKHEYGAWGLAYLEAIVRLADHRASEMRERQA